MFTVVAAAFAAAGVTLYIYATEPQAARSVSDLVLEPTLVAGGTLSLSDVVPTSPPMRPSNSTVGVYRQFRLNAPLAANGQYNIVFTFRLADLPAGSGALGDKFIFAQIFNPYGAASDSNVNNNSKESMRFAVDAGVAPGSRTFTATGGDQYFDVPAGVTSLTVTAKGAGGADGNGYATGGKGGLAVGTIAVTPGQRLTVMCGDFSGYGGGAANGVTTGNGYSGGRGGGMAAVWTGAPFSSTPLLIAGGGGGGCFYKASGGGGGATGTNGAAATGGTQTAGGGGANPGQKWNGGAGTGGWNTNGGGGGGGGWYGGGGGGGAQSGGGGGSGYLAASVTNGSLTPDGGAAKNETATVLIQW